MISQMKSTVVNIVFFSEMALIINVFAFGNQEVLVCKFPSYFVISVNWSK